MLKMDVSALMGYTGALYKDFFGSGSGILFTVGIMLLWIILPLWWAFGFLKRKICDPVSKIIILIDVYQARKSFEMIALSCC